MGVNKRWRIFNFSLTIPKPILSLQKTWTLFQNLLQHLQHTCEHKDVSHEHWMWQSEGQMCVDARKWTLIAWEERKRRKINLYLFSVLDMKAFLQLVLTCSCNGLSFIKMHLNCTTETWPQFTNSGRRPAAAMMFS